MCRCLGLRSAEALDWPSFGFSILMQMYSDCRQIWAIDLQTERLQTVQMHRTRAEVCRIYTEGVVTVMTRRDVFLTLVASDRRILYDTRPSYKFWLTWCYLSHVSYGCMSYSINLAIFPEYLGIGLTYACELIVVKKFNRGDMPFLSISNPD